MKPLLIIATLLTTTFFYSCDSTKKINQPSIPDTENTMDITVGTSQKLYNKKWMLQTLDGKSVQSKAFVQFLNGTEQRIAGNTGCNNFSGTFSFKSFNTIAIGPLVSTKMACLNTDILETSFLQMLENTNTWLVETDTLTLLNNEKVLGTFTATPMQ
ncbi:META domain-containing protein [Ferruginibacter yonginensis]|uniref:META domain-containing protein n=1 Tax=Ferruginibacter yonginensis TaxID=1310416 RepID=A0ABV8QR26_9BACT